MATKVKKATCTRERLLIASTEEFAARGFGQARVHEICARADANQAAVSYHFGGKYELYVSALRHALELSCQKFPLVDEAELPAQERLDHFLRAMCQRIFDEGEGSLFPKMMVKEMAEPTDALETIMVELIAQQRDTLRAIIRASLGPEATEDDILHAHLSVVGLFQFFNFSRSIRQLIVRKKQRAPLDVEAVIAHTVRFAQAGIEAKRGEVAARV